MLQREAYGPQGNPDFHLSLRELSQILPSLPADQQDQGWLSLIVRRLPNGRREKPQRAVLSVDSGLEGDGWDRRPPRDPEAQLAVIRRQVAELIANGQDLELFGDNLFVDLDISASNLPLGTRLQVGDAIVEVTAKPHNGCAKFHERFGADALRFVNQSPTREHNLRGIYWRVVSTGEVWIGAPISVISRPQA